MSNLQRIKKIVELLTQMQSTNPDDFSLSDKLVVGRMVSDAKYLEKTLSLKPQEETSGVQFYPNPDEQKGGSGKSVAELFSSYYDTAREPKKGDEKPKKRN